MPFQKVPFKRSAVCEGFWKDRHRELALIVRGELDSLWTPVGLWSKTRKTHEPPEASDAG